MTWDESLAALLGLIGRDVEVAVIVHGHAAPLAAHFTGVLAAGDNMTLPRDGVDAERLFFYFADHADTGFFVDRSAFTEARWVDEARTMIDVRMRAVTLRIEARARSGSPWRSVGPA